jgi:hypothetical protein
MAHLLSPDPKQPPLFGTIGFTDVFGGVHFACNKCTIQVLFPQEMPREEVKAWCCGRWVYLIPREDGK